MLMVRNARPLAPGEVVGVDAESVQVERGRALARARGLTNFRFQVGDVTALPFGDATFDTASISQVLQYLSDPAVALRELRRVLTDRCLGCESRPEAPLPVGS